MQCHICGQIPTDPVINRQNGCLFERKLIEKYIDENQRCPVTETPMSRSDLISVSAAKGHTPNTQSGSIPSMLLALQTEWDAVMLEQFSLRQQLTHCQQELSQSLYQFEASSRVIAKLLKERDNLRDRLRSLSQEVPDVSLDKEDEVLPQEILEEIDYNQNRLKDQRLRRGAPHNLAQPNDIASFVENGVFKPHSGGIGSAGVLCLDANEVNGRELLVSGGGDSRITCIDLGQRSVCGTLIGHTKPVRCVKLVDGLIISGSDDSTMRVWKETAGGYNSVRVIKAHRGVVVGLSVLPSQRHVLSAGSDGKVAFSDYDRGFTIASGEAPDTSTGFSCLGVHGDGALAVTGSAGRLLIWDVKRLEVCLSAGDGMSGAITGVSFNEDGYTLAASTGKGIVKIYDFRNIDKPIADLRPLRSEAAAQASNVVRFSNDGQYLAAGSNVVTVWDWKQSNQIAEFNTHTESVTDLCWGSSARWLVSSSLDKTVRVFRK